MTGRDRRERMMELTHEAVTGSWRQDGEKQGRLNQKGGGGLLGGECFAGRDTWTSGEWSGRP